MCRKNWGSVEKFEALEKNWRKHCNHEVVEIIEAPVLEELKYTVYTSSQMYQFTCMHLYAYYGICIAFLLLQGKESNSLSIPAHKCTSLLAHTWTCTEYFSGKNQLIYCICNDTVWAQIQKMASSDASPILDYGIRTALLLLQGKENNSLAHKLTTRLARLYLGGFTTRRKYT